MANSLSGSIGLGRGWTGWGARYLLLLERKVAQHPPVKPQSQPPKSGPGLSSVLTEPLGRSAYHSKAIPERLLTNWRNSRAYDPPTLQQLAQKWARCCLRAEYSDPSAMSPRLTGGSGERTAKNWTASGTTETGTELGAKLAGLATGGTGERTTVAGRGTLTEGCKGLTGSGERSSFASFLGTFLLSGDLGLLPFTSVAFLVSKSSLVLKTTGANFGGRGEGTGSLPSEWRLRPGPGSFGRIINWARRGTGYPSHPLLPHGCSQGVKMTPSKEWRRGRNRQVLNSLRLYLGQSFNLYSLSCLGNFLPYPPQIVLSLILTAGGGELVQEWDQASTQVSLSQALAGGGRTQWRSFSGGPPYFELHPKASRAWARQLLAHGRLGQCPLPHGGHPALEHIEISY
ncbi:hypothetical protein M5K25_008417 [Dendrobium thyrsiflorum]|uniref:Uncharacterized protein n=1 Tax=Dendrobium thyrsiflorum TaxID=117978 RepID=A0ABD0V9T1_DENTH